MDSNVLTAFISASLSAGAAALPDLRARMARLKKSEKLRSVQGPIANARCIELGGSEREPLASLLVEKCSILCLFIQDTQVEVVLKCSNHLPFGCTQDVAAQGAPQRKPWHPAYHHYPHHEPRPIPSLPSNLARSLIVSQPRNLDPDPPPRNF